jgi:mRNA interferase MazF
VTGIQWGIFRAGLDPTRGSEQSGVRPVVVVSRETANRARPIVSVLPLTSARAGRRIYPSEVLLPKGAGGLANDSIVLAHQVRTISKERLGRRIGELASEELREQVREAMRTHLDLD